MDLDNLTLEMPLELSCTHPTILVFEAGPHCGHGDQAAALHLGAQDTLPHLRRRAAGEDPLQCTGDTSLFEPLASPSTQRYFPT